MKLLVIEDDPKTLALMAQGLSAEGFCVQTCSNGQEGLRQVMTSTYDLVILDVTLPEPNGWEILKQLRRAGNMTRIVMVTARDAVEHRVMGLTLGADDYIVKPFAFIELVARIRTVLRRPANADELQCQDLRLDLVRRKAYRDGQSIDLSAKEFSLVELLLRHKGEVLSRQFIAEQIWDMSSEAESNFVDVNVRRVRSKIDDMFAVKLIKTVRGSGYVIR